MHMGEPAAGPIIMKWIEELFGIEESPKTEVMLPEEPAVGPVILKWFEGLFGIGKSLKPNENA